MNARDCGRGWIVLFCFMPNYDDFLHAKGNDEILSRTEILHVLIKFDQSTESVDFSNVLLYLLIFSSLKMYMWD